MIRYLIGMKAWRWVWVWIGCCACAGSEARGRVVAYAERGDFEAASKLYEAEGRPNGLLQAWAESMLLSAAHSSDASQQRAVWVELNMLGTRAESWLDRLSASTEPELTRAQALGLRLALGESGARSDLRALLQSGDPNVVDVAYAALDPEQDAEQLERALVEPRSARRSAALQVLVRAQLRAADDRRLTVLSESARFDPEPSLRAAALHALAPYGKAALPVLEAALRDPSETVRVAARDGLVRADPEAAVHWLDLQLGAAVNAESTAAACTLLRMRPAREQARAWEVITRGLSSGEAAQRGRTATLLRTLPSDVIDRAWLRDRLQHETQPELQLAMSAVLGLEDPLASATLAKLVKTDAQPAVIAATELAKRGDQAAHARLLALRTHASPLVRAGVARALGRELNDSASIASLLADSAWQVRLVAASAVLSTL